MLLVLCFAAVSFLGVFPLSLTVFHRTAGQSLLVSLVAFVLMPLLYVLFFWFFSLSTPGDRPIEKQNAMCRFAIGPASALVTFCGGVKPVITGMEKLPREGRFLFVCNHHTMFDPFIVMDRLRDYNISFISKPSNMKIPFCGRIVHAVGYLAIDRENDRNALKTILTAADYMKRDLCSIGIYPEGTRSRTGELLPFHAGSLKTAQRAKVPIVVASVRGPDKRRLRTPFTPANVYLDILDFIPAEEVCAQRTDALSEQVRSTVLASLERGNAQEE